MKIILQYNVFFISVIAAVWIILLLLTRCALGSKLYRRCFMVGWIVVLLRMLVPVAVTVPIPYAEKLTMLYERAQQIPFRILLWVWGAGVCVSMALFLGQYIASGRKLREALPIQKVPDIDEEMFTFMGIRVYVSDRILSPITYGILEQKVLLPKYYMELSREQLKYILIHEKVHIDSHDNLKKFLVMLAVCIHWFNPLAWLMYVCFNRDMELTCDEKVIRQVGEEKREDYANVLISLAEHEISCNRFRERVYSGFVGNEMRERIIRIMKYREKHRSLYGIYVCATLVALLIFVVPVQSEAEQPVVPVVTEQEETYEAVAVEKVIQEDTLGTKVNATVKTKEGVSLCVKIYLKKGFAMTANHFFLAYLPDGQEWTPGIDVTTSGTVTVPEAVRFRGKIYPMQGIGTRTFYQCKNLEEVILPDTVTEIKEKSFTDCSSLRRLVLSAKLEMVEVNPFIGCTSLEEFEMPAEPQGQYVVKDGVLYTDYGRFLKVYPQGSKKKTLVVDQEVTQIATVAFHGSKLHEVHLPETMIRVKSQAFRDCKELENVFVAKGTKIAKSAFEGAEQTTIFRYTSGSSDEEKH